MAELILDRVTKHFDDDGEQIVAVDEASIDIADGEFLVLVGPSGCGKSTTLRMIAGLETISEGEIRLGGQRINGQKPQQRDIAMVFQSYALYPHMTVRENMRFGLEESTDLSDDEMNGRVEESTAMMGIADLLDRYPRELSGGQQQRVALGRAIVRDPAVFLMDEPLSNLDAKLRSQMRTELQRIQEELGVTTVYVTHDQTEAMTMGDRIAILNDGRLQQVATPLKCYHRPANRFVAGFIGDPSMNFFDVRREDDRLVGDGFEYPLTVDVAENLGDGEFTLGIRPEDVEVLAGSDGGTGRDHEFAADVVVVEPMGSENTVHLRFEGGASFVASVGGMQRVREDETVTVHLPEKAIHVFDAETGEALHSRRLEDDLAVESPV